MYAFKRIALAGALLSTLSAPSHAFFDELVIGMTSVTNNLIDSSESVTNNSISAASNAFQTVSSNPGKMADRIGVMADRIGFMADRIVTTEGIMAGLAHKVIDSNQSHQNRYAAPMPVYYQAQPANTGYTGYTPHNTYSSPSNSYSASSMIYGVNGSTYTAATPVTVSAYAGQPYQNTPGYGYNPRAAKVAEQNSCGTSYGVALRC